ncbi:MAG TPA: hypothetical protein QGF63_00290 [Alphaproteobacteria bacterium]|jgi:hypothetical protein|nr:hypothetical protein [Alphaproteobacteria bacterium]MDP6271086.1 hypothetical protein [Alphaproteobacteria bacterium]MDP7428235.1 hypothetical protein [Alphaproteobacteria bacterium]HJM48264.1 hypothetical protein [Alphaproteobacteria bacterium]|tara:strand:+ start:33 stop:251 length:219 start_codon:yes stop_codon:yes gene_type:complete
MPKLSRTLIATAFTFLAAAPALAHGQSPSAGFAEAHAHPHGMEWLVGLAAVAAIAALFGTGRRWARSSARRD